MLEKITIHEGGKLNIMPYHKDKQQAYQAVQQGIKQVADSYSSVENDGPNVGAELKHLRKEVEETYQQIQNALETASDTQRLQLEKYEQDVYTIMNRIDEE